MGHLAKIPASPEVIPALPEVTLDSPEAILDSQEGILDSQDRDRDVLDKDEAFRLILDSRVAHSEPLASEDLPSSAVASAAKPTMV